MGPGWDVREHDPRTSFPTKSYVTRARAVCQSTTREHLMVPLGKSEAPEDIVLAILRATVVSELRQEQVPPGA